MTKLAVRVGSRSVQGLRPNNEDSFVADPNRRLFLVADGMGGQDSGERASGLAAEIIPKVLFDRLATREDAGQALRRAMEAANEAIVEEGRQMPSRKRMGTTAVVALQLDGKVIVGSLGDSRAYLIRDQRVEQVTVDHSVAQSLVSSGAMTEAEARESPWQHVLHKFLGCAEMSDGADIRPLTPQSGDRLLLATDGLTNLVTDEDLIEGSRWKDVQAWADYLVDLALRRGSKDNVTCIVVAFHALEGPPSGVRLYPLSGRPII
jgi:PPM family protein phosphatase